MSFKRHDQPFDVIVDAGEIHIEGPDGVAIAMTPQAAAETAKRLVASSKDATEPPAVS